MNIKKVGIIGAGNMGCGIAQKVAQEGIMVVMVDTEDRFVEKGMDTIRKTLTAAVERKIFTREQTERFIENIKGTTVMEDVKDADIVIEAIFEDMEVKKDLFSNLDRICDQKTILASNTSSFSITELANPIQRKDRFLGLHFFYHPAKNRLLEIIPGEKTSEATISVGNLFSRIIGKTSIVVKDAPGFAVNRFFVPWLNEAARLLEEGIGNIPTIDKAAREVFGIGMGPFELMNATGVPIAYHSTVSLSNELGDFYRPGLLLEEQFGKAKPWSLDGEMRIDQTTIKENIERRLLGVVFTIACQLVDEGVASIEDTDRGAKIGLRWKSGPFEMMNDQGIQNCFNMVCEFVERYSDLEVPRNLMQQYQQQKPWPISYVDLKKEREIARVIFNRPEAMNAINETVMQQLDERFTDALQDPAIKVIVLEGAGKAFVAGADIQYFIDKIDSDRIVDIVEFTKSGHAILDKIDISEKHVIAKLDGIALGGGAEIALAADTIVASEKARIGFPETGIGIYPGLGGTQRTTRYIGKELAKYLIFTGKVINSETAKEMGLIEYVVPSSSLDERIKELACCKEILKKPRGLTQQPDRYADQSEDLRRIRELFSDELIGKVLTEPQDLDEKGRKITRPISYKAPNALRLAGKLIDVGSEIGLEKGLQMELDHLVEIFSTRDAYEGLTSVVERRRPVFNGE